MEMKKYIEFGEKAAGNQEKLAAYLEQYATNIRRIKRGGSRLPVPMCIKLAKLIDADPVDVIMANELATEKNEEKRELLKSCLSKAAVIVLIVGVTMIVTPSPAHAAPLLDSGVAGDPTLYIMLNYIN